MTQSVGNIDGFADRNIATAKRISQWRVSPAQAFASLICITSVVAARKPASQ